MMTAEGSWEDGEGRVSVCMMSYDVMMTHPSHSAATCWTTVPFPPQSTTRGMPLRTWPMMTSSETSLQLPLRNTVSHWESSSPYPWTLYLNLPSPPLPPSLSGVNVSDAKCEEESMMLADANRLKNDPSLSPAVSPGGATMLHVVSAKNYLQVME